MNQSNLERLDRLDAMIKEGRILRHKWRDGDRACLLLALAPECVMMGGGCSAYCPADVLPTWVAQCVPAIDDCGTLDAWPETIREFARVVRLAHEVQLSGEGWERVRARFGHVVMDEALAAIQVKNDRDVEKAKLFIKNAQSVFMNRTDAEGLLALAPSWSALHDRAAGNAVEAARALLMGHMSRAVVTTGFAAGADAGLDKQRCHDRMATALLKAIEAECRAAGGAS